MVQEPNASRTDRLQIELMRDGLTNAHILANEAFLLLDTMVGMKVNDQIATPPGSPSQGNSYLITATATGVWTGRENLIAMWINGAWLYIAPKAGFLVYVQDVNRWTLYDGTSWNENTTTISALSEDFGAAGFSAGEETALDNLQDKLNALIAAAGTLGLITD